MRKLTAAIVATFGLASCFQAQITQCEDVNCPQEMICDGVGGCAVPEQLSQCDGQSDGTACGYSTLLNVRIDGACETGVCRSREIPACLFDQFLDSRVDAGMWELWLPANEPVVVSEEPGRLSIQIAPNVGRIYNGLQSRGRYDMLGGNASVDVVPANQEVGVETSFAVEIDSALGFEMSAYANRLHLIVHSSGGVTNSIPVEFDPVAMRWWRIRHDTAAGTMEMETSPDNNTWTSRRSAALARPPTAVIITLLGGTYVDRGGSNPGVAYFHRVKVTSGACP
ncbi:MAG: hypothetical protein H0T46_29615 [Deltaproteobacteria bacterium]|nr:hypothetical protein [Deltaproteobacteria bacterium]